MPIQASSLLEREGTLHAQLGPWPCGCHDLRHTVVSAGNQHYSGIFRFGRGRLAGIAKLTDAQA